MEDQALPSSVSVQSAAQMLHLTEQTIRSYLKSGKLEGFMLPGGHRRVLTSSIAALMNGAPKEATR